jgi:hypothetical protein
MDAVIGGYFELELHPTTGIPYPQAIEYQSARAAFFALLKQSPNVKRVWMPYYICGTMLPPVQAAGKEICFYGLDEQLAVGPDVTLRKGDLLLYINYFGICESQCDALLERFEPTQIMLDCSQAFYAAPRNCYATIYSPRKFFGLPDGGLLVTALPIIPPETRDTGSEGRMWHLIKRLADTAEAGYQDFKRAEDSLVDMEPRGMSTITHRLLHTVNFESARTARNRNFAYLRRHLDKTNTLQLPSEVDGPHCYAYLPDHSVSKDQLIRNKIFVATYWPDVLANVDAGTFEARLVNQCLPIPCDQRYNLASLSRILSLL